VGIRRLKGPWSLAIQAVEEKRRRRKELENFGPPRRALGDPNGGRKPKLPKPGDYRTSLLNAPSCRVEIERARGLDGKMSTVRRRVQVRTLEAPAPVNGSSATQRMASGQWLPSRKLKVFRLALRQFMILPFVVLGPRGIRRPIFLRVAPRITKENLAPGQEKAKRRAHFPVCWEIDLGGNAR